MTVYLSNRDGNGKTSEEGHYKFTTNTYTGNVLNATDLVVTALSTPAMKVNVAAGQYRIPALSGAFAYTGWNDSTAEVIISTSDAANPRISTIVMYVDKSASTSPTPVDNPGITKLMSVDGSPAASPIAPTNAAIQTAVGVGNPFIILANVAVPVNALTIITGNITDRRTFVKLNPNLYSASDVAQLVYPIGSLYINTSNSANPATILGFGTWVAFGEGRVPVGKAPSGTFATGGATGGAETHTLTIAQMPSHQHTAGHKNHAAGPGPANPSPDWAGIIHNASWGHNGPGDMQGGGDVGYPSTGPKGGNGAHNNLQPYIVVYMWTRTA